MGLRLRGNAWYLRKNIGGKRVETPLGVYGGEKNRKRAATAARNMRQTLSEGHAVTKAAARFGLELAEPQSELTFTEWWQQYADAHLPEKAERTQQRDRQTIVHWTPLIGHLLMAEIRQTHLLLGLQERRKAYAANPNRKNKTVITESTVQRERRFLQAVFERAVENDIIAKNPWKGVEAKPDPSRSHRILSDEDEAKLLAAMKLPRADAVGRKVRTHPRWERFVTFLLETGLRIDELLNDHFKDHKTHISVVGKYDKARDVALTTKARKALDEQWADADRPKNEKRAWWQTEQRCREVMAQATKRAKIGHLSPHDLRHTFGHRYLVKGGDIFTLSKILGHASVAVTEKHYAYLKQSDVRAKMLAVMERAK